MKYIILYTTIFQILMLYSEEWQRFYDLCALNMSFVSFFQLWGIQNSLWNERGVSWLLLDTFSHIYRSRHNCDIFSYSPFGVDGTLCQHFLLAFLARKLCSSLCMVWDIFPSSSSTCQHKTWCHVSLSKQVTFLMFNWDCASAPVHKHTHR